MTTSLASPLSGRVVVITGGARGIGHPIAKALAARGARVALSDIDEAALEAELEQAHSGRKS